MKKRYFSIVLFLVFFLSLSIAQAGNSSLQKADPESFGFSSKRLKYLEINMHALVDKDELSGIVISVARHGKIIYQNAYGKQDIEKNKPMKMDTIFRLASMTKPITGVAMMMLYEEGKWHPDDPLVMYFPEFKDLRVYAGADSLGQDKLEIPRRPLTVGDIMVHTSGFSYAFYEHKPVSRHYKAVKPTEVESMDEFINRMAKLPLMFHPGEGWEYGVSVDIQGVLIERLSGMTLADFMRTRIFKPLKMKDTAFFVPKEKLSRLVTVYTKEEDGLKPIPVDPGITTQPGFSSGGGGLYSTAGDYLRFAQMLMNEGELDGVRLLAPGTVRLMCSNKLSEKILNGGFGVIWHKLKPGYGFGYDVAVYTDPELIGSATGKGTYQWTGAAGTWFWNDPVNDIVFIGMIARMGSVPQPNIENLSRTLVHQALINSDQ